MKSSINDLAMFGGRPTFRDPLHVGRPNIGNRARFAARVRSALQRRWLTNDGPYLQEFENRIAELVGVRHCIAVANGTLALQLLVRAMGLSGEVILPSFTFVATAHALEWEGMTPVFVDVDPRRHTVDPTAIEARISSRTMAIVGVHIWGRASDTTALDAIARRHRLALIYDAAHALGCSRDGRMLGSFGDAEVLSFHATKIVNTFEGGAVVTNDETIAGRLRLLRNFGFVEQDSIATLGINGKMNEISAAMGLTSLESLDQFIDHGRGIHQMYKSLLDGIPGLFIGSPDRKEKSNYHYVVVEIDEQASGISRDDLLSILKAEGILARRYFYPGCHQLEPYVTHRVSRTELPVTERLVQRVMQLPTGMAVGEQEIIRVAEIIKIVIENSTAIVRRIQERTEGAT